MDMSLILFQQNEESPLSTLQNMVDPCTGATQIVFSFDDIVGKQKSAVLFF